MSGLQTRAAPLPRCQLESAFQMGCAHLPKVTGRDGTGTYEWMCSHCTTQQLATRLSIWIKYSALHIVLAQCHQQVREAAPLIMSADVYVYVYRGLQQLQQYRHLG